MEKSITPPKIKEWLGDVRAVCHAWLKRHFGKDADPKAVAHDAKTHPEAVRFLNQLQTRLKEVSDSRELTEIHGGVDYLKRRAAEVLVNYCMAGAHDRLASQDAKKAADYLCESIAVADEWHIKTDEFWGLVEKVSTKLEEQDMKRSGYSGPHGRRSTFFNALYTNVSESVLTRPPGTLYGKVLDKVTSDKGMEI